MSRGALAAGAALALAALALAGCGRPGPIRAPGPADQITYPRSYPAPERPQGVAPAQTPAQTPAAPRP
ncbi:hypothetical protein ACFFMP_11160 [Pseudoroseomonas cervicalis]|uniref:hypothetical protein n=1 Tax=Teichococcus cervicalis TaxID=204525 RepID=UPI0035E8642E